MDALDIAWLRSAEGQRATEEASALLATAGELATLERLARDLGPEHARAAVALLAGRGAAAAKFPDAPRLFFDRAAAEQASAEVVAGWTARRFAGRRRVADLGSGAGGDALALAAQAPVLAVDRDRARLAMLAANSDARGLDDRIEAVEAVIEAFVLPEDVDAVWLDPSRRDGRGRVLDPRRWSPPLDGALELARRVPAAGVKLAPGIDVSLLPDDCEVEFVSLEGRLVEAVCWLGVLAGTRRRATRLPEGATIEGEADVPAVLAAPGRYLYDLDPAVGRAGLVGLVARELGAWQLDAQIAYLSADEARESPFARRFRVIEWGAFSERAVRAALTTAGTARVEVMRRGSPVDANALEGRLNARLKRRLAGRGPVHTLALTRLEEAHVFVLGIREREAGADA